MSYVDYKSKDDLQDDTFKQVATLNWISMSALLEKNTESLVGAMSVLYVTCWKKMSHSLPKDFEERLDALERSLYGLDEVTDEDKSVSFRDARKLYKDLAGGLSDAGLLFRVTVDSSNIGAREEL